MVWAIQDQRDDKLTLGFCITGDVPSVRLYIRDENGGLSEESVRADAAWIGRGDGDELTSRFTRKRAQEEGVRVKRGVIGRRVVSGVRKV